MIKAGRRCVIGPEGTEAAGEVDPAETLRHSASTFNSWESLKQANTLASLQQRSTGEASIRVGVGLGRVLGHSQVLYSYSGELKSPLGHIHSLEPLCEIAQ